MSESTHTAELGTDLAAEIARYRDYLLMLARFDRRGRASPRSDESDVVHQALVVAVRDRHQFRGKTRPELVAWLRRILTNTIGQGHRRRTAAVRDVRREVPLWQQVGESSVRLVCAVADPGASPSAVADGNEQVVRLASALAKLPDDQREAVELRYLHGLAVKAIAERTGRNPPAVGGLLHRGLTRLRKLLTDEPE